MKMTGGGCRWIYVGQAGAGGVVLVVIGVLIFLDGVSFLHRGMVPLAGLVWGSSWVVAGVLIGFRCGLGFVVFSFGHLFAAIAHRLGSQDAVLRAWGGGWIYELWNVAIGAGIGFALWMEWRTLEGVLSENPNEPKPTPEGREDP